MNIVNQKDIRLLLKRDKIFAAIYKQYGPPPDLSREPGFVSLSKIILEQQVSLASANAHFQKLNSYIPEFSPSQKGIQTTRYVCEFKTLTASQLPYSFRRFF